MTMTMNCELLRFRANRLRCPICNDFIYPRAVFLFYWQVNQVQIPAQVQVPNQVTIAPAPPQVC